ncbi:hypothetical protein AVEN_155813-1 [Araneus ventricosus]|uniref:Protein kinase domain-containing protein n=1 Tax=Araneus ventricosus TaxID=182803 RepID=A0A4Y2G5C9_ARAVE|nr:hypothetical protein AVEN_155813-1 [Araneus ventricosus]
MAEKERHDSHMHIIAHLKEKEFIEKLHTALPAVEILNDDIQLALDFIHSFLRTDPSARMTAEVGMEHSFLGSGEIANGEEDPLWKFPNKPNYL